MRHVAIIMAASLLAGCGSNEFLEGIDRISADRQHHPLKANKMQQNKTAPAVRDPRCDGPARHDAMRDGADCS